MAALIDAGTGYSTVADWTDTTPQPDSASSGASLMVPSSYVSFLWPSFAILWEGRVIDLGGGGSKEVWGIVGQ